jgi:hypothetical protein
MDTSSLSPPRPSSGRLLLFLGLGVAALGLVACVVQFSLNRLVTPWYLPSTATLGVLCVGLALYQRRTVWRLLALLLLLVLAGGEWWFLLGLRLPPYTGPIAVGKSFPAFETTRSDGTRFTQRDLEGQQNQVLVFFRGRW